MGELVVVEDASDARVDDYRRLNDQAVRTAMEGDEFFIAEGPLAIDRLIESGHRIRSVLLGAGRVDRFTPLLDAPALVGVDVYVADRPTMRDIVGFDLHRGMVASAFRKPLTPLAELLVDARRLVVLEGLNDNENVGAIARAARAFGADGIVLSPTCTDHYYRRTVRVSMGEVLSMRVARPTVDEWPCVVGALEDAGIETWAMTPADDADDLWDLAVPDRVAVVLGAEGPGLTGETMRAARRRVRIPITAEVDSLNVGHAAAVTLAVLSRPTGRSTPSA